MNGLLGLILFLKGDFRGALTTATSRTVHFYVTTPQGLEAYLDDVKVPRWDQRLMFELRIVKVIRRATDGTLSELAGVGRHTQLLTNDHIEIDTSHGPYEEQLNRFAQEAKDYVFVAELNAADHFIKPMRDLMERRGEVSFDHIDTGLAMIPGGSIVDVSLDGFVTQIGQGPQARPPKDLNILTHVMHTGELAFSATHDNTYDYVSYEAIEGAGEKLRVPDSYLEPRVSNPPKLVIYGCEFARARPVLALLKEKMNPRLQAYAANHFVGANVLTRDVNSDDYFMYMCKPIWVHSQSDLSRADILTDLSGRVDETDANGVQITDQRWEQLVPPILTREDPERRGWFSPRTLGFRMPARNLPGGGVASAFNGAFAVGGMYRFPFSIAVKLKTTATRAQFNDDRLGTLKAAIAAVTDRASKWHTDHPYPQWVRLQFANAGEMVDHLDWEVRGQLAYLDGPKEIEGKGWGVKYCVMVPVQQPAAASIPHAQRLLRVSYYAAGAIAHPDDLAAGAIAHPDDLALTSPFWTAVP